MRNKFPQEVVGSNHSTAIAMREVEDEEDILCVQGSKYLWLGLGVGSREVEQCSEQWEEVSVECVCVALVSGAANNIHLCGLKLAFPDELLNLPEGLVPLLEDPDRVEAHLQGRRK